MSGFDLSGLEGIKQPSLMGEGKGLGAQSEGVGEAEGSSFSKTLNEALMKVQELSGDSKDKAEAMARGEDVEVHDLMISMGKSEVAFNLMLEVRNKILEAWQVLQRSVN